MTEVKYYALLSVRWCVAEWIEQGSIDIKVMGSVFREYTHT